jgi:predicted molibdopterin-dependent oxidoreductase YjgC
MLNGGNKGAIKALFMMGSDQSSVQSSSNTLDLKSEGIEFLLVSDITLSDKVRMADVVFPSCTHAEKDGTFTNAGRRVQSFQKAIRPVGDSLPEWQILCNLATEMGEAFNYSSVSDIMDEISTLVPSYKGINYPLLGDKGVQLE